MERRTALRGIALGIGGLASLPSWANAWTPEKLPKTPFIPNEDYLNPLAEVLIPTTDTPGAGELGVGNFIVAMINDCTPEAPKKLFTKQLGEIDTISKTKFSKGFAALNPTEKTALVESMATSENEDWKTFFTILKRYTIQGYMTTEDVLTRKGFEFAPGRYLGCVDVVN